MANKYYYNIMHGHVHKYLLTLDYVKLGAVNLRVKGVVFYDVLIVVGSKQTVVANETEEHWNCCVCVHVCICYIVRGPFRKLFKWGVIAKFK